MNNNRRKKEMTLFIAAISLTLSVILLGWNRSLCPNAYHPPRL